MPKVSINIIKDWFKNQMKPPQEQFWAWLDSFWHKDEPIPQSAVENLVTTLQKKADLVNGVVPEEQLPFSVQTSEVLAIGEITATSNQVNLAVHSLGKNKVRIKGKIYERAFPNSFSFTAVVEFTKILILYAMPDSAIFYLAEGTEAQEAVEPELPENALIIRRIVVNLGGVTMDENSGGYKSVAEDNWRTVSLNSTAVKVISMGVTPASSFDIIPTIAGTKIGGIGCKMDLFLWDGKEWWFRNDSLFDVALEPTEIQNTYNFKATTFAENYLLKSKSWAKFKLKNGVLILVEFGGSANFPEDGNNGYVLEKDTAAEGGVKWSNSLHTEIATKQDKSLFSNLADKWIHYYDLATAKLQPILHLVSGVVNQLEFSGRIKADALVLPNNTNPVVPNRLRSDGKDLYYSNDSSVESKLKTVGSSSLTLIHQYIHSGNIVILPTAIDYATGYITVVGHGQSFAGVKLCGLFKRGIVASNASPLINLTNAYPDEYMAVLTYVKVIDANTLMICNSAGSVISVNTGGAFNTGLNVTGWQLEIFVNVVFDFPEISADYFSIMIGGYSVGIAREFKLNNGTDATGMLYITSAAPSRKNNVFSVFYGNIFKSGNFKNITGIENGTFRNGTENRNPFNTQIVPHSSNFLQMADNNVSRFISMNAGAPNVFPYCNGSVIEIYKQQ